MNVLEANRILKIYQLWRKGEPPFDGIPSSKMMPDPKVITEALNTVITFVDKTLEAQNFLCILYRCKHKDKGDKSTTKGKEKKQKKGQKSAATDFFNKLKK